ncbi:hypothetical protein [Brevibacterium sp. CFH 10365]|uniref:hypothetical protein n=1 Tax=Brevibacterium sp. CFH 10365 TaxID=2585207 RepID=UPI0012662A2F|nr:hypothetical protein [Brevibacterium sp. CFH 10365]
MSSPQHPTGSGPQPWQDQPPQYPGQNAQHPGGQPPAYGSGPGQFGSAPGPAYGSAPGPYGSAPGQPVAAQGPYGSAPGQYGSGPGPYGSAPGQFGSAPGPYGSAPGQFGQAPAPKQKTGPGILGPLTLRDLFLLFAGLLAFIALFVPYRGYSYGFGRETTTLWHWNVADMGALVFAVLTILLIVAAVLVNKLGNSRLRVGSLSLDQFISVLSAIAFTYGFIDLLTSAVYWHVGSYLTFFAALIAFFAGVFTMLPFFAKEFAGREDIETHPKARPVTKHTPHPAPVANVPGAGGPGAGAPGFAPYGSAGAGQSGPGQPDAGHFGQPGGPAQSGQPAQFGAPAQPGQPAQADQSRAEQFGQPSPYAPPEEQAAGRSASSFAAPAAAGTSAEAASPVPQAETSDQPSADGPVHSTGEGQTYLGRRDSEAPQHSQSEPTQSFGVGAGGSQADALGDQPTRADGRPAESNAQAAESDAPSAESDDKSGAAAAAAGAGVIGAGAAGVAAAHSDSERRRGRHAAPESETGAEPTGTASAPQNDEADEDASADKAAAASATEDEALTVVPPTESSDLVSKVNAKSSDTNAVEGANTGADSDAKRSIDVDQASAGGAPEDARSNASPSDSSPSTDGSAAQGSNDDANVRSTDATVVSTPADGQVVAGDESTADDQPTTDDRAAADDDEQATAVMEPATRAERTTAAESEEPTQYVPVADYANRPETDGGAGRSNDETMAQTAVDSQPVPADAGQNRPDGAQNDGRTADQDNGQEQNQDGGRPIIQAFWFAVPEPREAVDETTGMPVFTIYPGDWYLSLEDNGSWFKVRASDGSTTGILRNIEGIQRG